LGVSVNPSNNTLSVSNIHSGSVAQRAGLQVGDQIVSINGRAVRTHQELSSALSSAADLNNATTLAIRRNGQLQNLTVDLSGSAQGAVRGALDASGSAAGAAGRPILGVAVDQDAQGIRIRQVNPGSVAERLQLQPNDRIVSVNGRRVMSSPELATELNGVLDGDGQAAIVINRNGQTRTVNHTFDRTADAAGRAGNRAGNAADNVGDRIGDRATDRAGEAANRATGRAGDAADRAGDAANRATERAGAATNPNRQ
jgi:S1-C subfamily serine protease